MSAHSTDPRDATSSPPTDPTVTQVAAFHERTPGPSRKRIGLVAAGAVALVAIAAATSLAASPAPSGTPDLSSSGAPGAAGDDGRILPKFGGRGGFPFRGGGEIELGRISITAIDGDQVTLGTPDGWRRTITVTSSTTLSKGGQTITPADLKVGDQVRFRQTRNSDGTFTVTQLVVVVPTIRGQVSDVTSGGFKVTTRDGSVWTITTVASTKVRVGSADGTLADIRNGDTVLVAGTSSGTNALSATAVRVAPDRAIGTVTGKTADSITIKRADGSSLVIHVTASTTFRVKGTDSAKLSDVAVGMVLGASGRARADGSIDATVVAAGQPRAFGKGNGNGKRSLGPAFIAPDIFGPLDDGSDDPTV